MDHIPMNLSFIWDRILTEIKIPDSSDFSEILPLMCLYESSRFSPTSNKARTPLIWNKKCIAWKQEHASQNAQVIRYDKKEKKQQWEIKFYGS